MSELKTLVMIGAVASCWYLAIYHVNWGEKKPALDSRESGRSGTMYAPEGMPGAQTLKALQREPRAKIGL